ncbi:MAG: ABC transporter ATP-binding protein [Microthrixaceae bacterium]
MRTPGQLRGRLDAAIDAQRDAQLRARFFFAVMFPVSDVLSGVLLAVIVGAGVWWGPSWGLQAGSLLAVVFLANMIVQPVAEIGEVLDQTQTALAGWRKALSLLDVEIEVVEPSDGIELSPGALGVKVRDLSFAYEPGRPVLSEVDLEFPVGVNAAIVGETGSGKSTLAKLLVRLVDPTSGSVQIDGIDLRDVAQISRSKAIRLVPQDGFLFEGTIGENVLFGMSNAVEAAPTLEQAPGSVHAADSDPARAAFDALDLGWWVDSLPHWDWTQQVGERGNALSVGERQLVALARAQIADPGLLILDEATSAVDPETERAIADALVKLTEGRTTISIAHRLSTAEAADLVVVFDAGRVVQVGPHEELLAQGGVYGRLHESWVGNTRRT